MCFINYFPIKLTKITGKFVFLSSSTILLTGLVRVLRQSKTLFQ